jgi:hypothetical protein
MLTLALFLLTACSSPVVSSGVADAAALMTAQAANPLPTEMAGLGLRASSSTACLAKEDVAISVSDPQGDLLAWSPVNDELAYVRPSNDRWAWFVGDLVAFDFKLNKEVYTSDSLEVFGDLTWAPDGHAVAYVVLDPAQKTYTVHVANMNNGTDEDIFAATSAHTDEWSSTKGVTRWESERNVVVTSSCGLDCARIYNYNTLTGQMTIEGDERKNEDPSLTLINELTSPDGTWQVSTDSKDNLWLSNTKTNKAFILVEGKVVSEAKWSIDSQYLALRTADQVLVYHVGCKR